MPKNNELTLSVNCSELDSVIDKANRLVELLREASQIINSLSGTLDVNILADGIINRLEASLVESAKNISLR